MTGKRKDEETLPPEEAVVDENVDVEAAADEALVEEEVGENWQDKYLRTLAELDNFRKRTERDRVQQRQYANEGLMRDLLPVLDALEMARTAEGDAEAIREGVKLAVESALRIMGERGLEPIPAEGEPFDPRFHEAVGVLPDPETPPNTVVKEERRGYRLKDRVVRPSRVLIAIAPPQPKAPAEEDVEEE